MNDKTGRASESLRKRTLRNDALSRSEIVRLRLLRMTPTQIAEKLGAKRDTVSGILQEPDVIAAIAEAEDGALEDAKAIMRTMAREAAQVLHAALSSDDERIRVDAAKSLLTKSGADAPAKGETKAEVSGPGGAPLVTVGPEEARRMLRKQLVDKHGVDEGERLFAKIMEGE